MLVEWRDVAAQVAARRSSNLSQPQCNLRPFLLGGFHGNVGNYLVRLIVLFVFDSEIWEPIDLRMILFTHDTCLHTMPLALATPFSDPRTMRAVQVTVHPQKCDCAIQLNTA